MNAPEIDSLDIIRVLQDSQTFLLQYGYAHNIGEPSFVPDITQVFTTLAEIQDVLLTLQNTEKGRCSGNPD